MVKTSFRLSMLLLLAVPLSAATVSRQSDTASWTGATFTAAANVLNSLAGCFDAAGYPKATPSTTGTSACEAVTLTVDADGNQGLGVVIDVAATAEANEFNVFVYRRLADGRRGNLIDKSTHLTGPERAFIENGSGDYYIVVTAYAVTSSAYVASALVTDDLVRNGQSVLSYLHDVSEKDPNITVFNSIVEQHRVVADDGVEIDTWIVRPNVADRVPVVLKVTPYYGGGTPVPAGTVHYLGAMGNQLIPRGYAYGIVSIRGTGNSGGCFTMGGPTEAIDTSRVVEHYAAQPWSNGNVGLVGASYDGTAPQDAWVEATPSLKTIVPVSAISDMYKYNFVNAVHIDPQGYAFNAYYWAIVGLGPVGLALGTSVMDPANADEAIIGEVCMDQVEVQEGGLSSGLDGNKDIYWQRRDFLAELLALPDKQRASVFYIHGLEDWNVKPHNMEEWLTAVQATGVPFKAWLGQWGHAFPTRADWFVVLSAWLDQFLKERDTGILDAPPVQMQTDGGWWRHENDYLVKSASTVVLHPQTDGTLQATEGSGTASYYDYNGNVIEDSGALTEGVDRVVFISAPLEKDLLISGMPRFEGVVTASGTRANLVLTLAEQASDASRRSINFAAQSLNHVGSLEAGEDDVTNEPKTIGVNFFPQDDVVRAGSRLVLIAAGDVVYNGSNGPELAPSSTGSTMTIDLATAKLVIPLDKSVTYEP